MSAVLQNALKKAQDIVDAPTGSENEFTVYIVGDTPTVGQAFEGMSNKLVMLINTTWTPFTPSEGDKVYVVAKGLDYRNNGTTWVIDGQEAKKHSYCDVIIDGANNKITLPFTPVGDLGVVDFGYVNASGKWIPAPEFNPETILEANISGKDATWEKSIDPIPANLKARVSYNTSGN